MSTLLTFLVQQPAESDEMTRNSFLSTVAILIGILVGLGSLATMTKKWVNKLVQEQQQTRIETKKNLKTNNGKTVGEYSEQSYRRLDEVAQKLDETHKISLSALALTRHNSERLDQHMEGHPVKEK